jgi:hypothetical protein
VSNGTNITAYLNGELILTSASDPSGVYDYTRVGGMANTNYYMHNVRVTKGARYTEDFTPPTVPFPTQGLPKPVILSDDFNTISNEWAIATQNTSTATIENGALKLSLSPNSTYCSARILSDTIMPTDNGAVEISIDWKPGYTYSNASGIAYLALTPVGISRAAYYAQPVGVPTVKLGYFSGDTTQRTIIEIGITGSTGSLVSPGSVNGVWNTSTFYRLKWVVNFDLSIMYLYIDDELAIAATPFSYTPSGDHFLEIANCGYAVTGADEYFDSLTVAN